jgi:hypothetical protein
MKKLSKVVQTVLLAGAFLLTSSSANADEDDRGLRFSATLSGAQEVTTLPGGVDTNGTGKIRAQFDKGLTQVVVRLRTKELSSSAVAAHFHCAPAGQNGNVVFGLVSPGQCEGLMEGKIRKCTLTNEDFTGNGCSVGAPVNNIAALAFAMREGRIYVNVHTPANGGGEIRGQMLED